MSMGLTLVLGILFFSTYLIGIKMAKGGVSIMNKIMVE